MEKGMCAAVQHINFISRMHVKTEHEIYTPKK